MVKEVIAIIPARGGSKRIPKKNTINFFGKPLIIWTVEAAIKSDLFERILVSTDDPTIVSTVEDYGLKVPFLRERYQDDLSPVSKATIFTLEQVEKKLGEKYQTAIQLMPTCPLKSGEHIRDAYNNFLKSKALFQISCFKFGWMNPWWAVELDKDFHPSPLFPEAFKKRSQDMKPLYCPTGAIWIANVEALKSSGTFYGESHIYYPIDWKAAIDIDNPEDLEMAKAIFKLMKKNR